MSDSTLNSQFVQAAADLASSITSFDYTSATYERKPDATIESVTHTLNQIRATIDVHQSDETLAADLSRILQLMQMKLNGRRQRDRQAKLQAEMHLRELRIAEEERALASRLAPDLSNPELIRLLDTLRTWPEYHRMDDYQVEDVTFMLDRYLRTRDQAPSSSNLFIRGIINANATGMGKTLETIAFLWVMRQINPSCRIIWFTKTPLVKETAPESTNKWHFPMIPIFGTTPEKVTMINVMNNLPSAPCYAINYEAVNNKQVMKALGDDWDFMIIDEVHKLRGGANYRPTQIWENTKQFKLKTNAFPIMLSGSVISNNAKELWAYLNIMDDERWPTVYECEALVRAAQHVDADLTKILTPSLFRRRKDEVSIKMPERVMRHHILEMDPSSIIGRVYEDFATQMQTWLLDQEGKSQTVSFKNVLQQLSYLRAILVAPSQVKLPVTTVDPISGESKTERQPFDIGTPIKLDYVAELANELLEEGRQVVIVSASFNEPLKYIAKAIDPRFTVEHLYGDNTKYGGDIANRFRNAETQVILTNLASGAEGFNLQRSVDWPGGAEDMIFIDDWYNPEKFNQMMDRIWRRGALNRCFVHLVQVDNTVDQAIELIRETKTTANSVITESTVLRAGEWKEVLAKALGRANAK